MVSAEVLDTAPEVEVEVAWADWFEWISSSHVGVKNNDGDISCMVPSIFIRNNQMVPQCPCG